jgi:hypothetical protein
LHREEIGSAADELFAVVRADLGLPSAIAERAVRVEPILVRALEGQPSYWLVPIAADDRLAGFLRLSLGGKLLAYGRFGQAQRLGDCPPLSHVSEDMADQEIHKAFAGGHEEISRPQLVHDGPVDRIAWLSRGRSADGTNRLLFWTFGISYSRREGDDPEWGLL